MTEVEHLEDEKPRTSRWRRLAAGAGVAALVSAGTVVAAAPAHADSVCGSYHNWVQCIYLSGGVLSTTAYNHYSVAETEYIWLNSYEVGPVTIPAGGSASIGYASGGPVYACAGLDSVQIVCGGL